MELLNIEQAASFLKISKASIKNWVKQGYISVQEENLYSKSQLHELEKKIVNGEIDRLNSRANKSNSLKKFIPTEYINNAESRNAIENVIEYIIRYNIKPSQAMFLLSINILVKNREIDINNLSKALEFNSSDYFKRKNIYMELREWYLDISNKKIDINNKYCNYLLNFELPVGRDILGIIYQSIISEGKKSSLGSYYSPKNIVESMVEDGIQSSGKVLDPCCGTGQFLLSMAEKVDDPTRIWGVDIDEIAVRIARVNILLFYKDQDFKPNILNLNSLLLFREKGFSFIATNPPWGAKFKKDDITVLRSEYPVIGSTESFSFFINLSLNALEDNGRFSFLLPESILYVKNHSDIRSLLLNSCQIGFIESFGRLFKKVFSPVIRLDGTKGWINEDPVKDNNTKIKTSIKEYFIPQKRFINKDSNIMDVFCDEYDQNIIDSIYRTPHFTLKGRAQWALGVVTGNNSHFIHSIKDIGTVPIYKGRDVNVLKLSEPTNYIDFKPTEFQQCAKEAFYTYKDKLIYKFISNKLVFAYDNMGVVTLNSANILIPKIEGVPVKIIGAILNSSISQFIFKKKINAIKVLRRDIETLPIPKLSEDQLKDLTELVEDFLKDIILFSKIDDYIFSVFSLSFDDKEHILNYLYN